MKQNYSQPELDNMMRMLEPTVSKLESLGLADKAYVYGFDEEPVSYGHAIYRECRDDRLGPLIVAATLTRPFLRTEVFGAVKAKYPKLRTIAVLRWDPAKYSGADLSKVLDIWVNLYSLWDEESARAWTAFGGQHEAWGYHCISPRPWPPTEPVKFLNTFIEDPAVDARLLSWWSLRYGAQGWLYYLVDGWQPSSPTSPNVPLKPPTHQPLRLRANSSLLTDFSPKRFNSKANAHPTREPPRHRCRLGGILRKMAAISLRTGGGVAFSNGDGILIWPGASGPLTSIRFENYRDGLEVCQVQPHPCRLSCPQKRRAGPRSALTPECGASQAHRRPGFDLHCGGSAQHHTGAGLRSECLGGCSGARKAAAGSREHGDELARDCCGVTSRLQWPQWTMQ